MNAKSSSVLDYIRHQIGNILVIERSLSKSLPADPDTAQTLSRDNIEKLNALLQYIDGLSDEKEVMC